MAILSVPITFQIFQGNRLVREATLDESVIKIGKLASSQLRLEDETVSRMHAVVEVVGPGRIQLIDLGSTRGTMVNGARINQAALKTGDQIHFGDSRVVVTFASDVSVVEATPPLAVLGPRAAPFVAPLERVNAEADFPDGSKALEVQTLYRDVPIKTRHLTDVTGKNPNRPATAFMGAGLGFVMAALAALFTTMVAAGHERARYEKLMNDGGEAKNFQWTRNSPALDLMVFGGIALGLALVTTGLKRRTEKSPNFIIGSDAKADAPVAPEFVGATAFSLVSTTGTDFLVNVTPNMAGEVQVDGQSLLLPQLVRQRGPSFSLGDRGVAKIECGATTFLVRATSRPRTVPAPWLSWRWAEQGYTVGTSAALLLFLLMIFAVPPDPKSLSLDLFNADNKFIGFFVTPSKAPDNDVPPWLKQQSQAAQGGKGQRHTGAEGQMGKKTSKNKAGLYAIKGPKDNQEQFLAKQLAEEQAKTAGILGVIRQAEGSHIASIFGRETALGSDATNVLGGLVGTQIGEAYGVNGLGLVGTGWGGGGPGEGTLGLDTWGTLGKGGGGGDKAGYGRGVGGLNPRRAGGGPGIIPGQASVRGSLDKEIIRRIIRRHINEVKYCYEAELTKQAGLAGRVSVQFTIAGTGQVIASVLQSSTMGNVRVESCVVQAIRRWEFPKPNGGGIVIVSYPFAFTAGGGGE